MNGIPDFVNSLLKKSFTSESQLPFGISSKRS
jgi:hypothetical protein